MSELPKWVDDIEPCDNEQCCKNTSHLRGALAIAMEALEKIQNHGQQDCSKSVGNAEETLARIRALGGEE